MKLETQIALFRDGENAAQLHRERLAIGGDLQARADDLREGCAMRLDRGGLEEHRGLHRWQIVREVRGRCGDARDDAPRPGAQLDEARGLLVSRRARKQREHRAEEGGEQPVHGFCGAGEAGSAFACAGALPPSFSSSTAASGACRMLNRGLKLSACCK